MKTAWTLGQIIAGVSALIAVGLMVKTVLSANEVVKIASQHEFNYSGENAEELKELRVEVQALKAENASLLESGSMAAQWKADLDRVKADLSLAEADTQRAVGKIREEYEATLAKKDRSIDTLKTENNQQRVEIKRLRSLISVVPCESTAIWRAIAGKNIPQSRTIDDPSEATGCDVSKIITLPENCELLGVSRAADNTITKIHLGE